MDLCVYLQLSANESWGRFCCWEKMKKGQALWNMAERFASGENVSAYSLV